ncbi:protein PTST homolog 2, chloroplastic isoform X1, partial [Tanacetum coccineum]
RKMKRSQTGVFSLSLKLYPGRYEIKFIVDGVWRVDPLRPIVSHDGLFLQQLECKVFIAIAIPLRCYAAAETSHVEMPKDIKSQLQQMQIELSSALCLLRSKSETPNPEGHKSSSNKLHQLSDTWEFQENEIMNSKDRLRSIRSELAVLEGKMTLSINEAQKMVKAKQRGVDTGSRTLHLHTTYIIWPNSASEVFLAGSFDGWTTQVICGIGAVSVGILGWLKDSM